MSLLTADEKLHNAPESVKSSRCTNRSNIVRGTYSVVSFSIRDFLNEDVQKYIRPYLSGIDYIQLQRSLRNEAESLSIPATDWRKKRVIKNSDNTINRLELVCRSRKEIPNIMQGIESIYCGRRLF